MTNTANSGYYDERKTPNIKADSDASPPKGFLLLSFHLKAYTETPELMQVRGRLLNGEFDHNSITHLVPQAALAIALEDAGVPALAVRCRAGEYDDTPENRPIRGKRKTVTH